MSVKRKQKEIFRLNVWEVAVTEQIEAFSRGINLAFASMWYLLASDSHYSNPVLTLLIRRDLRTIKIDNIIA